MAEGSVPVGLGPAVMAVWPSCRSRVGKCGLVEGAVEVQSVVCLVLMNVLRVWVEVGAGLMSCTGTDSETVGVSEMPLCLIRRCQMLKSSNIAAVEQYT